jgi:hypothetical protein
MNQFILIRIDFGFAENKSATGGLFVLRNIQNVRRSGWR